MCHKGHGYGRMHGPHIMEEWWVGSKTQRGPEEIQAWRRPFKRFRAAPHDVWLMSQPVTYDDRLVWVADTGVYTLPMYRLAGIRAVANGEFSTDAFAVPAATLGGGSNGSLEGLSVNVDASWKGFIVTGGCDEGCAAYLMAELQDANTNRTIPGFERGNCILMNIDGLRVPLKWDRNGTVTAPPAPAAGSLVRLRFYFRDATIYSFEI